jgi:hypothetical protein
MPPLLSEAEMSSIVEAGGGKYVGIMNEIPGKNGIDSPVHFATNENNTGTSEFTFDGGGGTQATRRIRCGLQRRRFEMMNGMHGAKCLGSSVSSRMIESFNEGNRYGAASL